MRPKPNLAMRRSIRYQSVLSLVAVALALVPIQVIAQGTVQTHTVRRGDTLWDIAGQYLGDPFRWPEIYRRNTETVQDPHWIYPDQVLIISGDVAPTPGTPADTLPPLAAGDPEPVVEGPQEPVWTQRPMTIFNPQRFRVVRSTRESLNLRSRESAVRPGDYLRSPYMVGADGIRGTGSVGATTSADGVGITLTKRPIQLYDRVYVNVPADAAGEIGERYLTFRYGPTVSGQGRVVIPTGVVKVITVADAGRAEVEVIAKYEDVYSGHHAIPLDTLNLRSGVFPTRVEFGPRTKISWIDGDPVLPGLGQYVIFAAGEAEGLAPGDQITLQRDLGNDERGVPLPPEDIAVVQVTRVTEWGASGVILAANDGGIRNGMAARVTAKMP